jgi:hypothetical protein
VPAIVRLPNVELNEGARQLFQLPRRGRLAGAQPDDHVLHSDGLTGLEHYVADNAVTLVQEAEHGDAIGHGGNADGRTTAGSPLASARPVGLLLGLILSARTGRRKKQRDSRAGDGDWSHAQSGVQGW